MLDLMDASSPRGIAESDFRIMAVRGSFFADRSSLELVKLSKDRLRERPSELTNLYGSDINQFEVD